MVSRYLDRATENIGTTRLKSQVESDLRQALPGQDARMMTAYARGDSWVRDLGAPEDTGRTCSTWKPADV